MDSLDRTLMTIRCRDCDSLPKVADAGRIVDCGAERVQVMHNGLRVVEGGYHGDWMAHIIRALRGHHEPQEELVFANILRGVRADSVMIELGSYWSYYTLWYLQEIPGSTAIAVEPDSVNLDVGKRNAVINGLDGRMTFVHGAIGEATLSRIQMIGESSNLSEEVPQYDFQGIRELVERRPIELLHMDIQGAELGFLQSMTAAYDVGCVRFVMVSTHHSSISGSSTTHTDCLECLKEQGALILVEHDVHESFSGDGLIVASFRPNDSTLDIPDISRNRACESLFPTP